MEAQIISQSDNEVALKQFDADGEPISMGNVKFTSRCQSGKNYQTAYGVAHIERYAYQTSKGGKVYIPLESGAGNQAV